MGGCTKIRIGFNVKMHCMSVSYLYVSFYFGSRPFEIFASQQYQELTSRKGEECFIEEGGGYLDESVSC